MDEKSNSIETIIADPTESKDREGAFIIPFWGTTDPNWTCCSQPMRRVYGIGLQCDRCGNIESPSCGD